MVTNRFWQHMLVILTGLASPGKAFRTAAARVLDPFRVTCIYGSKAARPDRPNSLTVLFGDPVQVGPGAQQEHPVGDSR